MRQIVSAKKMREIFGFEAENISEKTFITRDALKFGYKVCWLGCGGLLRFVLSKKEKEESKYNNKERKIDGNNYLRDRDQKRAYRKLDFATIARYEKEIGR